MSIKYEVTPPACYAKSGASGSGICVKLVKLSVIGTYESFVLLFDACCSHVRASPYLLLIIGTKYGPVHSRWLLFILLLRHLNLQRRPRCWVAALVVLTMSVT